MLAPTLARAHTPLNVITSVNASRSQKIYASHGLQYGMGNYGYVIQCANAQNCLIPKQKQALNWRWTTRKLKYFFESFVDYIQFLNNNHF